MPLPSTSTMKTNIGVPWPLSLLAGLIVASAQGEVFVLRGAHGSRMRLPLWGMSALVPHRVPRAPSLPP